MNLRRRFARAGRLAAAALLAACLPRPGQAEPPAPPLAEQLARARAADDPTAVAELCRRQLAQSRGGTVPALLRETFRAQLADEDPDAAAETLDQWEKLRPLPAELAEARGDLAVAGEKPLDDALAAWREALTASPADAPALLGKVADALDQAGRWPEAVDALQAFLKARPGHAARTARLAVCLLSAGQPEAADQAMLAASRADAADATVKAAAPRFDRLRPLLPAFRALDARLAAGGPPGSGNPAQDVSAGAKTVESAQLDRALLFFQAGAWDAALADTAAASEATGGHSMAARLLRGQCLYQLGRAQEAAQIRVARLRDALWFADRARFDRLRAADRAPFQAAGAAAVAAKEFGVRAAILLEADQPVLALEDAEQAARLRAGAGLTPSSDAEVIRAAALLRNERPAEALAAARRAAETDPRNADAWAILGRLEQEDADFPAAVADLSRALALREDPRWLRRRETCLRSLGRNAEAERDALRLARLPASS